MEDIPQDASGPNRLPLLPGETDTDELFGRRLREWRTIAGLTQRQLAERMAGAGFRMHQTTIAKIEAGERSASIGEAVELARILGVNLTDLVTDRHSISAAGALGLAMGVRENWARQAREAQQRVARAEKELRQAISDREFASEKLGEAIAEVEALRAQERETAR